MKKSVTSILEGLTEARDVSSGLPSFKAKSSCDKFMNDVSWEMEKNLSKELTDELGRCQILMSAGQTLPDKTIDDLEISISFDKSKDPGMALSYIIKEFEKFSSITGEQPTKSARPGYAFVARNHIREILKALESVYGITLDKYFTKGSLKNL